MKVKMSHNYYASQYLKITDFEKELAIKFLDKSSIKEIDLVIILLIYFLYNTCI